MSENLKIQDEQNLVQMKYGETILKSFNPETDLEFWENKHDREYLISITLPEFCCLCPRSGYPDFATIYLDYIPDKLVVELKTIKLYINSFMNRNISHEDSINEIYEILYRKLSPKYMKIVGDFNPRGNVHTVIEICSDSIIKAQKQQNSDENRRAGARRIEERQRDKSRDERRNLSKGTNKDTFKSSKNDKFKNDRESIDKRAKRQPKDGFRKISYEGDKKVSVVKKDK